MAEGAKDLDWSKETVFCFIWYLIYLIYMWYFIFKGKESGPIWIIQ